jgi:hypothetical protein
VTALLDSWRLLARSVSNRLRFRFGTAANGVRYRELPYVFFIGFNRTATRSIHRLFVLQGIPSVHWHKNRIVLRMLRNITRGRKILSGYDSQYLVFSDVILATEKILIEGNSFFRELYRDYPGSLFVLNTRPTQKWIKSRVRQKGGDFLRRQLLLLSTQDSEVAVKLWENQKNRHEEDVRSFFSNKPEQFLEIDIEAADFVEKLSSKLPYKLNAENWQVVGRSTNSVITET